MSPATAPRRGRAARLLGAVLLVGSAAALCSQSSSAGAATSNSPINLFGEGSWDVGAEMLGWQNDLYGSSAAPKINLGYVQSGGPTALGDVLTGTVDYAISGIPYTTAQLAHYPGGASGIIAAPVMPDAVGFLLNPAVGGFAILNGSTGVTSSPYTGPVREPSDNVIAQMFNYGSQYQTISPSNPYLPYAGQQPVFYGEWDNPAIIGTWDSSFLSQYNPSAAQGDILLPTLVGPSELLQAEANESTYYMEAWAAQSAPNMWHLIQQAADPHPTTANPWQPSPQIQTNSARGASFFPGLHTTLASLVHQNPAQQTSAGLMTPAPASSLEAADLLYPQINNGMTVPSAGLGPEWVQVQNANGDWVAPTPASIDAAIDATPATAPTATTTAPPLYGGANRVAGAYPATYVDYLYAPAHGLSVAKTEALATVIRYLATDGQNSLAGHGDGRLPSAMVLQSLNSANQLVTSNCPAADVVNTAQPGPYTPGNLPGLAQLGRALHCEAPTSSPTTSTTSTTLSHATTTTLPKSGLSTSGGGTGSGGNAQSGTGAPSGGLTGSSQSTSGSGAGGQSAGSNHTAGGLPSSVTDSPTSKQGGGSTGAQLASELPLGVAAGTQGGLDKLGALAVGVFAFVLLRRRPAGWVKKVLRG